LGKDVDGRDKPGHDGVERFDYFAASPQPLDRRFPVIQTRRATDDI